MTDTNDSDAATDVLLVEYLSSLTDSDWTEWEELVDALEQNAEPWGEWRNVNLDGSMAFPYVTYSPLARRAMGELGRQHFAVVFDWPAWYQRSIYEQQPELVDLASPTDAIRLLVRLIRGERFSEGTWYRALDDGTVATLFRRVLAYRD